MDRKKELGRFINTDYDPHVYASPQSDEYSIEFEGFKTSIIKQIIYWLLVLVTFGFLWLLARWVPSLYVKMNCTRSSISAANRVCAKVSKNIEF